MSTSIGDLTGTISLEDQFSQAISMIERRLKAMEGSLDQAGAATTKFEGHLTRAATVGSFIGNVLADTALKAIAFGKNIVTNSLMAGARLEQLGGVTRFLGERAGYTSGYIDELATKIEKSGITGVQSRDAIVQLISAHIDLSKATELSAVAQNMATISGESSSETFAKIVRGITTLQPQLLKTAGFTLNLESVMRQYKETTGKSAEALTGQQKQQLLLNAVLKEGAEKAGLYGISMEFAGKQAGSAERAWAQVSEQIGTVLLPITSTAIKAWYSLGSAVRDSVSGSQAAVASAVKFMAEGLQTVITKTGELTTSTVRTVKSLYDSYQSLPPLFKNITTTAIELAAGIWILNAAVTALIALPAVKWIAATGIALDAWLSGKVWSGAVLGSGAATKSLRVFFDLLQTSSFTFAASTAAATLWSQALVVMTSPLAIIAGFVALGAASFTLGQALRKLYDNWQDGRSFWSFFGKGGGFWDDSILGRWLGMSKGINATAEALRELRLEAEALAKPLADVADKFMALHATDMVASAERGTAAWKKWTAEVERLSVALPAGIQRAKDLETVLTQMRDAHMITPAVFQEAMREVKELGIELSKLPPFLQEIELARQRVAAGLEGLGTKDLVTSLKDAQDQVAKFTGEQKANIIAGKAMGISAEKIAEALNRENAALGITEAAVSLYTKSLDDGKEAAKKFAEATQAVLATQTSYGENLTSVNYLTRLAVLAGKDLGASEEHLAAFYRLTVEQVDAVITGREVNNELLKLESMATKATASELAALGVEETKEIDRLMKIAGGMDIIKAIREEADELLRQQTMSSVEFQIDQINRRADKEKEALLKILGWTQQYYMALKDLEARRQAEIAKIKIGPDDPEFMGPILDGTAKAKRSFHDMLDDWAAVMVQMAQVAGDEFDGIIQDIANIVVSWNAAAKASKAYGEATTLAGKAMAIAQGASAVAQATGSGSRGARVAGGAMAGAQMGSIAGPWGAAVGAGVGALVGYIRSLNGVEKEVNKVRQAFVDAAGGLGVLNLAAHEAGMTLDNFLHAKNVEDYTAAVKELNAAIEHHKNVVAGAQAFGFSAEELQKNAKLAQDVFDYMLASGKYSAEQLTAAYRAFQQALADTGDEAAKAWLKMGDASGVGIETQRAIDVLKKKYKELAEVIKNEAPEKVTGVIEQRIRDQMDKIKKEIEVLLGTTISYSSTQAQDDTEAAGYKTIKQLQEIADKAQAVYMHMRDSGEYAAKDIADAFEKASKAQDEALGRDSKAIDELKAKYKSLADSVSQEAPEEVMGVIETQMRGQMEALDKEIKAAQGMQSEATAEAAEEGVDAWLEAGKEIGNDMGVTAETIEELLRNAGRSGAQGVTDAFDGLEVHVKVIYDYDTFETRALGGPVSAGQPYLVGERGPEMFVPEQGGAIIPHGSVNPQGNENGALLAEMRRVARLLEAGHTTVVQIDRREIARANTRAVQDSGDERSRQQDALGVPRRS